LSDCRETSPKVRICNKKAVTTGSEIARSSGNEAGSVGGVVSRRNLGPVRFRRGSSKVTVEGRPAVYLGAPTSANGGNALGAHVRAGQSKVLISP
jgi:hypothetical protein